MLLTHVFGATFVILCNPDGKRIATKWSGRIRESVIAVSNPIGDRTMRLSTLEVEVSLSD